MSTVTDPTPLGTILSIWAHPDDETYLAGGLMAAARDQGQRVVCVAATAGELGTDDPATWSPQRLGAVRRWEAAAAMAILGVDEHGICGLPDGGLADREVHGRAWVARLLETVRPDTILTFGPDGMTYHPDHLAVHQWVLDEWMQRGRPGRLLYATPTVEHLARYGDEYEEWGMYMTDERPEGVPVAELDLRLVLGGVALDRKVAALRAMATQTSGVEQRVGAEAYAAQVSEEAFVDATTVLATLG
jgi:LmbE family N-acetylglucosaminyl deacetylase